MVPAEYQIKESKPLIFVSHDIGPDMIRRIDETLGLYLAALNMEDAQFSLVYSLRELAENAKKANLKRIYFEKNRASLDRVDEYTRVMKSFKDDVYSNINNYIPLLKEKNLYVKFIFFLDSSHFVISLINNSSMTAIEKDRIKQRLLNARAFTSMEEAFRTIMDDEEGAGLGLIMLILMLQKIGLDKKSFIIRSNEHFTEARITIPRNQKLREHLSGISEVLDNEVHQIPQLPENIQALQVLLSDPDVDFTDINKIVRRDPALTGEILKTVNSASFGIKRKISSLSEAISLMGMNSLRNFISLLGAQKVMNEKYGEMRELWSHSYRCAQISQFLIGFGKLKKLSEDAYVGCLLHDIGKVILDFVHPQVLENIKKFCLQKNHPSELFESVILGVHHAELGAIILKRWEFPQTIIDSVQYHHFPDKFDNGNHNLITLIYFSNFLSHFEKDETTYEELSPTVAGLFSIKNQNDLDILVENLVKEVPVNG